MLKITRLIIFLMLLIVSLSLANAYPVTIVINGDRSFTTEIYRCNNADCTSFSLVSGSSGSSNSYTLTGSDSQKFAEFDFTSGFFPQAFFISTDDGTGAGPWPFNIQFERRANCRAPVSSVSLSSSSVQVNQVVTVTARVQSVSLFHPSGPQAVPSNLQSIYSDTVTVILKADGSTVETKTVSIPFSRESDVTFTFTPTTSGTKIMSVETNLNGYERCTSSLTQSASQTLSVTAAPAPTPTPTPPAPTVDLDVDGSDGPLTVTADTSHTLSWTSSNANSCTASGSWLTTGSKATSGSESTGTLSVGTPGYTLSCTGTGGTSTDTVTVNVVAATTPTTPGVAGAGNKLIINDIDAKIGSRTDNNLKDGDSISRDAKPGDTLELEIEVLNHFTSSEDLDIEDITVTAAIEGIDDGDDLEDESSEFDLRPGRKKTVKFDFKVPLIVEEDSYDILIEAEGIDENGTDHSDEATIELEVDKDANQIIFSRAFLSPLGIKCSRAITIDAELLNIGSNDQDNVVYEVKNSDLSINIRQTNIEMSEDIDEDSNKFIRTDRIQIQNSAASGSYPIELTAFYDNDKKADSKALQLTIEDCEEAQVSINESKKVIKQIKRLYPVKKISIFDKPIFWILLLLLLIVILIAMLIIFRNMKEE